MAFETQTFFTNMEYFLRLRLRSFGVYLERFETCPMDDSFSDHIRILIDRNGRVHSGKLIVNRIIDMIGFNQMYSPVIDKFFWELIEGIYQQCVWHYKVKQIRQIWGLSYGKKI